MAVPSVHIQSNVLDILVPSVPPSDNSTKYLCTRASVISRGAKEVFKLQPKPLKATCAQAAASCPPSFK